MKKAIITTVLAAVSALGLGAQAPVYHTALNYGLSPQIMNIAGRETMDLGGTWKGIVDQYENGYYSYRMMPMPEGQTFFADRSYYDDRRNLVEYDFDSDMDILVPGDWNTQSERLYYYEGSIWYRRKFDISPKAGKRYFVYFGAVNYESVVALNGHIIGKHTGGYTPFNIEITEHLRQGENTLMVKADNKRRPEGVPTVNSDWWNYGGITRDVCIVETPETFIREYFVQLKPHSTDTVSGWIRIDGPLKEGNAHLEIGELGVGLSLAPDADGFASFEFRPDKGRKSPFSLWSPENPKLYDVTISYGEDRIGDRIGFRCIETRGNELYLNGKKIFCRGICIHEEQAGGHNGRAFSKDHARTLLGWAKEMNCNFVRLAHYPHNENMVRAAEEMGIMVWSEIPVYWTIHWDNPQTYENAEAQLRDMVIRDRNRANVIIWSVANETPRSEERLSFLTSLIGKTREMDGTRLISAAMEKEYKDRYGYEATVNDELTESADLISFNQYVGWYDGDKDKCGKVNWSFGIDKPVFISEYGGGALYGLHGDADERFTEEYQEELYRQNVEMLSRIPGLCGSTPWILKDFRSPRRQLKGIQDDFNRKGLISSEGQRKKAFYVMQEWYRQIMESETEAGRKTVR